MSYKKVDNRFTQIYVPNNLPWFKYEGLLSWYDQIKSQEF